MISCSIHYCYFEQVLCDLEARVNISSARLNTLTSELELVSQLDYITSEFEQLASRLASLTSWSKCLQAWPATPQVDQTSKALVAAASSSHARVPHLFDLTHPPRRLSVGCIGAGGSGAPRHHSSPRGRLRHPHLQRNTCHAVPACPRGRAACNGSRCDVRGRAAQAATIRALGVRNYRRRGIPASALARSAADRPHPPYRSLASSSPQLASRNELARATSEPSRAAFSARLDNDRSRATPLSK